MHYLGKHPWRVGLAVGGIGAAALLWGRARRMRKLSKAETNFTAAYPRNSGAISAVTGGDPEDINMMPAVITEQSENVIYDGSSLSKSAK